MTSVRHAPHIICCETLTTCVAYHHIEATCEGLRVIPSNSPTSVPLSFRPAQCAIAGTTEGSDGMTRLSCGASYALNPHVNVNSMNAAATNGAQDRNRKTKSHQTIDSWSTRHVSRHSSSSSDTPAAPSTVVSTPAPAAANDTSHLKRNKAVRGAASGLPVRCDVRVRSAPWSADC